MKVVHLGSSDSAGGAALASVRLHNALLQNNIDSRMLVRHKCKTDNTIFTIDQMNYFAKKEIHPRFIAEKLLFLPFEKSKKERFAFSTGKFGFPVHQNRYVRDAEILHIHWINSAFISLKGLKRLAGSGKPIVWTLHDMWAFTGGCHYTSICTNYFQSCGNCPILKNHKSNDISNKQWLIKKSIFESGNFSFVTCSKWLHDLAKQSSLLRNSRIEVIPNPIDTSVYKPIDKRLAGYYFQIDPAKKYLFFTAGNLADPRKGFSFLKEAILFIQKTTPEKLKNVVLLLAGKNTSSIETGIPVETKYLGYLTSNEAIINAYSLADIFVLPSLEDNLPNTIMEALSCGTPCVGFKSGGIPEMIIHKKNGYLAEFKSSEDLATGIQWVLSEDIKKLSDQAREFALENYSEMVVGQAYSSLYQSLLKQ